ncbi:hypothetical protein SAMN00808754_1745 [Thermanaeromonas toyohensis ToBE]|uniref:Uncharacterized protein n=1 Tax=Thermanaeromonas toyohensis ToBE TaxID=698762 RepID=A0A1W1VVY6_9FIRM|nr:hypothetical protein [Thermanaeromonas toyohensis]SMB97034.1 hypothetical protein SAMN00808754_1745 [Thermanaeromonas toyohensis ToBE]
MLYTRDAAVAEAANKVGLLRMAEYYNLREEGKLVGWQFVGPREKVLTVAGGTALPRVGEDEDGPGVVEAGKVTDGMTRKQRREEGEDGGEPEQLRLF